MRRYIALDFTQGYTADIQIFYECGGCGVVIPSMPEDSLCCSCENICIDIDAGRVSVKDISKFMVFEVND